MSAKKSITIGNIEKPKNDSKYDSVVYESYSFPQTRPSYIGSIGKIFGINAVNPSKCRVLEMGCSYGMNIIPLAALYPDSEFVGIDLSKTQIDEGKKYVKELKLKNVELKQMSITDLDESFGKFDYIICHGVFSWVPNEVRDSILLNSKKLLSENGIAYISYNALPGWNMLKSIKDMMVYHSKNFEHPQEKVTQARAMMQFVSEQVKETDTPYARLLKQEIDLLANQRDSYIFHDHLEDNNVPFYLHEFADEAKKNGLQYVADTQLSSMYVGNYGQQAQQALSQINDIIRQEQYLDFINNRRFRSTVLCHDSVNLNRVIGLDSVKDLYFLAKISASSDDVKEEDFLSDKKISYTVNKNQDFQVSASSPFLKYSLKFLSENSALSKFEDIVNYAEESLAKKSTEEEKIANKNALADFLIRLVFSNGTLISLDGTKYDNIDVSNKPKAWNIAMNQVENNSFFVTNKLHECVKLSVFDAKVLFYCDGNSTVSEIESKMLEHFKKSDLNATVDGNNMNMSDVGNNISSWVKTSIVSLKNRVLLD